MQEAFEKIKERLEERLKFYENRFAEMSGTDRDVEDWGSIKSYKDAIEIVNQVAEEYKQDLTKVKQESNQGWIPFKQREATEEEKEFYGEDCKYMLDCQLPEEDEEIFVTYRWKDGFYVGNDIFLKDGCECYLESGREFVTEAIAWQPLPEPYRGE